MYNQNDVQQTPRRQPHHQQQSTQQAVPENPTKEVPYTPNFNAIFNINGPSNHVAPTQIQQTQANYSYTNASYVSQVSSNHQLPQSNLLAQQATQLPTAPENYLYQQPLYAIYNPVQTQNYPVNHNLPTVRFQPSSLIPPQSSQQTTQSVRYTNQSQGLLYQPVQTIANNSNVQQNVNVLARPAHQHSCIAQNNVSTSNSYSSNYAQRNGQLNMLLQSPATYSNVSRPSLNVATQRNSLTPIPNSNPPSVPILRRNNYRPRQPISQVNLQSATEHRTQLDPVQTTTAYSNASAPTNNPRLDTTPYSPVNSVQVSLKITCDGDTQTDPTILANKACQFDGIAKLVANKKLNATVDMIDKATQVDDDLLSTQKPQLIDRASSPIDIPQPVRRKTTAKRPRIELISECLNSTDSDEEINISD